MYRKTVVCRTEEGVSVVSASEVLVLVVTADGKNPAKKYFGKAQNSIEMEGWKKEVKKE
jgi:hypothetical protein